MQLTSSLLKDSSEKFILFLNLLINPNRFLLDNQLENTSKGQDIRSSSKLTIVGKKIIHFLRTLFLIVADNTAIVATWLFLTQLSIGMSGEDVPIFVQEFNVSKTGYLLMMLVINLSIFSSSGLYGTKSKSRRISDTLSAYSLSYLVFVLIVGIFEKSLLFDFSSILVLTAVWLFSLFFICLERFLVFRGIDYCRSNLTPLRRKVLLVGTKKDIGITNELFSQSNNFQIVDTLDLSMFDGNNFLKKIYRTFFSQRIDEVIICSWEQIEEQTKVFWALQTSGISWRILPLKQSIPQLNHELADIDGIATIRYGNSTIVGIDFLLKRLFDIVLSSLALIVLGLPMLLISLLIRLDSPGSIFYRQTRVGLKGRKIKVWKFRTMVENASQLQKELESKNEVSGGILFKISDDPRITSIGKFLRRYSLDELPQLFNVLKGEMSLVGPRPLPIRDVEKFEEHHNFRHEVLPGITGLWQVSGRSDTSSDQVFRLDFEYIENWSLAIDLKIMLKTVQVVFLSKGAY